jgi:DeoR/GlpR family transcriptional regulator of sugar metabolism
LNNARNPERIRSKPLAEPADGVTSSMKAAERHSKLRDLFSSQEFASIEDLCRTLRVSEATTRRDLNHMEKHGLVRRVHGGALSLLTRDEGLDFGLLSTSCSEEKVRIGRSAAMLVEDGQTVILGGGSTAVEVARHLSGKNIHVVTNSIPIMQVFWDCKYVDVTSTGGYLYPRLGVQLGPICEHTLAQITADILVMGIGGMSEKGLSDSNALIVSSIRKMIEVSRKVVIVADHTKFGRDRVVPVAPLPEIDVVVTDDGLRAGHRRWLRKEGIEVILA